MAEMAGPAASGRSRETAARCVAVTLALKSNNPARRVADLEREARAP
jgi:hypothetical protein